MNLNNRVIARLVENFGAPVVLVRSQYHVQVEVSMGRYHDVWLNDHGSIKWRLCGCRQTESGSVRRMVDRLNTFQPIHSDVEVMAAAVQLARDINGVSRAAAQAGIIQGVFCDAGYKDGRARIALIALLDEGRIEANVMPVEAADSQAAEEQAIQYALGRYDMLVYSDCESAVLRINDPRVHWIDRRSNRTADSLANLRGTS